MFKVNDDLSIYVTRGDSASFTVTAVKDEEEYTFPAGSVVRLKVYERKGCECVVLQKDFPVAADSKSAEITLTEIDTRIGGLISKPKDYWYEIELNPFDNPETIIGYDEDGAKVFKLFPEGKDLEGEVLPEDIPVVDVELDMTSTRPVENQAIARKFATIEQRQTDADGTFEEIKNRFYATDAAIAGRLSTTGGIITGNIAMSGKRVTSLGEPTAAEDAVNLKYANEHYAERGHGHNVSDIGNFPASMPASDVHEWAKDAKKPSYTAVEVGARPNDWMPTAAQVGATPASHAEDKNNPHGVTAAQVGARPNTWMPTASEVGARPNTWTPTAAQVGAVPTSRKVNGKTLSSDITLYASDVGARPNTWMPSAADVGARPNTWTPNASEVGARPATWLPSAAEIGAVSAATPSLANMSVKAWAASLTSSAWAYTDSSTLEMPVEVSASTSYAVATANVAANGAWIELRLRYVLTGCEAVSIYNYGWNEWEWVNPPMDTGMGYKTTERWSGYPVYVKLIDMGALPNNSTKEVVVSSHAAGGRIISAEGYETSSGQKIPSFCFANKFANQVELPFSGLSLWMHTNFNGSTYTQALIKVKYIKY